MISIIKKNLKLTASMLAIAIFAITLTSCEGNENDDNTASVVKISSVKLSSNVKSIFTGEKDTLTATLRPDNVPEETLTWISSNDTVASVVSVGSLSGEISALTAGTAIITARTSNRVIDICELTVTNFIELNSISIMPKGPLLIEEGTTDTLYAMRGPANATNYYPVWSSSNNNVVTMSETGVVRAVSAGEATVTISSGSISASVEVEVVGALAGIAIEPTTIHIEELEETKQLAIVTTPVNAVNVNVVWKSSDHKIVSVSAEGLVTAIGVGTATVTATSGKFEAKVEVTVTSSRNYQKYLKVDWTADSRGGTHPWDDLGDCGPGTFPGCPGTAGGEAYRVIDDNQWTGWHSAVAAPLPQCLVVNMNESLEIDSIEIWHRPDAVASDWIYYETIEIYVSNVYVIPNERQASWGAPVATHNYTGGNPVVIKFPETKQGQWLILYFPNSTTGYISFAELEVFKILR